MSKFGGVVVSNNYKAQAKSVDKKPKVTVMFSYGKQKQSLESERSEA